MNKNTKKISAIFIIGAKSIGKYGGYETFVDYLLTYHENINDIKYYVACKYNGKGFVNPKDIDNAKIINDNEFIYHNALCYRIKIPSFIGNAQAIIYDFKAMMQAIKYIKDNNIEKPIIYILGCKIGPFIKYYSNIIHSHKGKIYINTDGLEWKRLNWNYFIRKYLKFSEELMVKYSDLVICDNKNIEKYIHNEYDYIKKIKTTYISYGADLNKSTIKNSDEIFIKWINKYLKTGHLDNKFNNYYLVVGRFVPENNFEIIIKEYIKTNSDKKLIIITNKNNKLYSYLNKKFNLTNNNNIIFSEPIYNQNLLKKIRECAYGYIHGHSVGGTNPSLLEAMSSTKINLVYDCDFNKEVSGNGALYWNNDNNNLCNIIKFADALSKKDINILSNNAINKINKSYTWKIISNKYKNIFTNH